MTEKLHFLYDGFLLIAELKLDTSSSPANSAPTIMRTYHWEPTQPVATRPLSLTRWTKQTSGATNVYSYTKENYFLTVDLQKNVSAILNNEPSYTSGTAFVLGLYRYDSFGNFVIKGWSKADDNPFRFSSEYHDEALGLIYYNYRHYNPHDGRWINRDPIAEQGGTNIYGFIANNAVNAFDSLGKKATFPEVPLQQPNSKKDCKPKTFIMIGGAMDSKYGGMSKCLDQTKEKEEKASKEKGRKKSNNSSTFSYYHWDTDRDDMAKTIQQYQKNCPKTKIIVVGHSYGGDTAMDIAETLAGTGQKITLVTLDPVSSYDSHNWNGGRPDSVDYWVNAYIDKGVCDYAAVVPVAGQLVAALGALASWDSNIIASAGGKWGHESGADVNIPFPMYSGDVNHALPFEIFTKNTHKGAQFNSKSNMNTKSSALEILNHQLN